MKKYFATLISFTFLLMPISVLANDVFLDKTLDKSLKIKTYSPVTYSDNFVKTSLNPVLKIDGYHSTVIHDEFAENNLFKNINSPLQIDFTEKLPEIKNNTPMKISYGSVDVNNFIPVSIKIKKYLSRINRQT